MSCRLIQSLAQTDKMCMMFHIYITFNHCHHHRHHNSIVSHHHHNSIVFHHHHHSSVNSTITTTPTPILFHHYRHHHCHNSTVFHHHHYHQILLFSLLLLLISIVFPPSLPPIVLSPYQKPYKARHKKISAIRVWESVFFFYYNHTENTTYNLILTLTTLRILPTYTALQY